MASETESPTSESSLSSSFIENLINSRNRDLSHFLPFILAFTDHSPISTTPVHDSANPDQQTRNSTTPPEIPNRIILVNPLTQGMVVIETSSSSLEALMADLLNKEGQPPASRASIDALPSLVIGKNGEEEETGECVICLEEWEIGEVVKEMPCKHRFHGGCIKKWLKIHGSCPICRYQMPIEEDDDNDVNKKSENRGRRREIWVSFSLGSGRD